MTVAEMIARRTTELTAIKADSNAAVAAKGGTPADNLLGLPAAIESIPSGGELPELTNPAEVGHVVAGKEYIDAAGNKQTGTMVVCDTIQEVETIGLPGVGVQVELESTADGSTKTMTLPEPNLKSENIKSGVYIFGLAGSVKEIRTETGTITPAEGTKSITIPGTDGAKAFILEATDDTISAIEGQSLTYAVAFAGSFLSKHNIEIAANTVITIWRNNQYANGGMKAQNSGGVTLSSSFKFYPGTYRWTAYYWENDA